LGVGTFLMFAARHLDVHPTRLQELAAAVDRPAAVGSYCSVFAGSEILERLREGSSREEVALGCIHSIAERVHEIGGFAPPLKVTGGVPEYFPGVLRALAQISGMEVSAIPEPIMTGALGAALKARQGAAQAAE
jgi:activator of 2-hydroxyglutaryl-CoA dehydratase